MGAVLLAVGAAVSFGLSDFFGGVAARSTHAVVVALISQVCAGILAVSATLLTGPFGAPSASDAGWAALAGIGSAFGNVLIYRGIARYAAQSVAPASGLVAMAIPVLTGFVGGESLNGAQWLGLAAAIPAIWLASGGGRASWNARRGVGIGIGAGAGFGLQFACLGQISGDTGLAPLAWSQLVSALLLGLTASLHRGRWSISRVGAGWAVGAGACAGMAAIAFQLSVQLEDLSVVAVVTAMYPAVTVVFAAIGARRWWTRSEGSGLVLCIAALVLIAW